MSKSSSKNLLALLGCAVLVLSSCSDETTGSGQDMGDDQTDLAIDAGLDRSTDELDDVIPVDAPLETVDLPEEPSRDLPADGEPDAADDLADAIEDGPSDPSLDTSLDAQEDGVSDPSLDTSLDAQEDGVSDPSVDTSLDALEDGVSDPSVDTFLDALEDDGGTQPITHRVTVCAGDDWQRVLQVVPLLRTDSGEIEPFIALYVDQYGTFDLDSALTFLQRYEPAHLRVVDSLPVGIIANLVGAAGVLGTSSTLEDLFETTDRDVVYVQDDYELALLAASYAAMTERALVIAGGDLDRSDLLEGRQLLRVGAVSCPAGASCSELALDLDMLRTATASLVDTGAIIMVNPDDRSLAYAGTLETDLGTTVHGLYAGTSLMAPYLAAAREELIVTVHGTDVQQIDTELEAAIQEYVTAPSYLTIMASPLAIPIDLPVSGEYRFQLDTSVYGSLGMGSVPVEHGLHGNDTLPDLHTGRIMGLTLTDVSTHLVNSLFYQEMSEGYLTKAYVDDDGGADHIDIAHQLADLYTDSGWALAFNQDADLTVSDLIHATTIYYAGHGGPDVAGFMNTTRMQDEVSDLFPAVVFMSACLTCRWNESTPPNLLCTWLLRRGAMAVVTAVGYGNDENKIHFFTNLFNHDWTTGRAFVEMRRLVYDLWFFHFMNPYVMLGDPLFNPDFGPLDAEDYLPLTLVDETHSGDEIDVVIEFSQPIDTTQYLLYDTPIMPDYSETATNQVGQPTIHYRFSGFPEDNQPTVLEIEYLVSPDWSWRAEYSCSLGAQDGDVFDFQRSVCNATLTEVCQGTDCQSSAGSSVGGITFGTVVLIRDYEVAGEGYVMTRFSPVMDASFPYLDGVAAEPVRTIQVHLHLEVE